jgi:hypothetical protein
VSLVKIQGNASGTGIFTVAAPNSNTDRTLTLPDNTGTIATAESTLSQFNASGSAPVYACRAWVNFNGTGTVAIRASGNVSSITDFNTGNYRVNFSNAMPDGNYAFTASLQEQNWGGMATTYTTPQAGSVDIYTFEGNAAARYDPVYVYVAIFR